MQADFEIQDRVVELAVAVVGGIFVLGFLFRLFRRPKGPPTTKEAELKCKKCGYYLVSSDATCPNCHTDVEGSEKDGVGSFTPPLNAGTASYAIADIYRELRDKVFALPSERQAEGFNGTVAVLMETGHPKAIVTLVVLHDGSTSLYFSNGGGVIGAGQHTAVATAAMQFMRSAELSSDLFEPTTESPLPRPQHTRFFLLSTVEVRTTEALEEDLGHNRHKLSPLFHSAHAVIAAVRQNTQLQRGR